MTRELLEGHAALALCAFISLLLSSRPVAAAAIAQCDSDRQVSSRLASCNVLLLYCSWRSRPSRGRSAGAPFPPLAFKSKSNRSRGALEAATRRAHASTRTHKRSSARCRRFVCGALERSPIHRSHYIFRELTSRLFSSRFFSLCVADVLRRRRRVSRAAHFIRSEANRLESNRIESINEFESSRFCGQVRWMR